MATDAGQIAFGNGSVDRGLVLSWTKLPAMGLAKITHFELAVGHDELDEYGRDCSSCPYGRRPFVPRGLWHQSLWEAPRSMGGVDVSSVKYSFGYVTAGDGYPKRISGTPGDHCEASPTDQASRGCWIA